MNVDIGRRNTAARGAASMNLGVVVEAPRFGTASMKIDMTVEAPRFGTASMNIDMTVEAPQPARRRR